MARHDQSRDGATGQYGQAPATNRTGVSSGGDEPLNNVVSTKITASELRAFSIMFDQCRKQFGWQTMSDMYRSMLSRGYTEKQKQVKNPTSEMRRLARQAEELEVMEAGASKHRMLDRLLDKVEQDIHATVDAGDLAEVRQMLNKFRAQTEKEDDPAIKNRRIVEFDRRWSRLYEGINRGVSLDPKTYVSGDDK